MKWQIENDDAIVEGDGYTYSIVEVISEPNGFTWRRGIALVTCKRGEDDYRARLVAAAPEMMRLLKNVVSYPPDGTDVGPVWSFLRSFHRGEEQCQSSSQPEVPGESL